MTIKTEIPKGQCVICMKETEDYCPFCASDSEPVYYCDEHYRSVVLTGNCCWQSEASF